MTNPKKVFIFKTQFDAKIYNLIFGQKVHFPLNQDNPTSTSRIINSNFDSCGIRINNGNIEFTGNQFKNSKTAIYITNNANPVFHNNDFYFNDDYAINNVGSHTIDATNNWWGAENGPYNENDNPEGLGNKVSSKVNFSNYLKKPYNEDIVAPIINLTKNYFSFRYINQTSLKDSFYIKNYGYGGLSFTINILDNSKISYKTIVKDGDIYLVKDEKNNNKNKLESKNEWIFIDPNSGVINKGDSIKIIIELDPNKFPSENNFSATLEINSNDHYNQKMEVNIDVDANPVRFFTYIKKIDMTNFPNINLYCNVRFESENLRSLDDNNFTIWEDGYREQIINIDTNKVETPVSVMLIVDVSGSMNGSMDELKDACNLFIDLMKDDDRTAIIKFSDSYSLIQEFTSDKSLLHDKINSLTPGGGTQMYNALWAGLELTAPEFNSSTMIAFTDGASAVGNYTTEQIINHSLDLDIPIYTIGLGSATTDVLKEIAYGTNGEYYYSPTVEQLTAIFQNINASLQTTYKITYKTHNTVPNLKNREVILQTKLPEYNITSSDTIYYRVSKGGSISGIVKDANSGNIIKGANVKIIPGGYIDPDGSNDAGEYLIEGIPEGKGYTLKCYAYGYLPKTITPVNVFKDSIVVVDIQLNKDSGKYIIQLLNPDPNPDTSYVGIGGSLHRYYQVIDEISKEPISGVMVRLDNGQEFTSGDNGIVDIKINDSEIGNGNAGETKIFTISYLNNKQIANPFSFICKIKNVSYFKKWQSGVYTKLGVSFFSIEKKNSGETKLIEKDNISLKAEDIEITRQVRAQVGVDFDAGVGAKVKVGPVKVGGQASIGAGGSVAVLTEDYYRFSHKNYNDLEAVAQYLLFADGSFNNTDEILRRLLSVCEEYLIGSSTLDDAYLGDKKGIDVKVGVEASAFLGVMATDHLGIGIDGNLGVDGHGEVGVTHFRNENYNEYNFGLTGSFNGSIGAGIKNNLEKQKNKDEFNTFLELFDFDGKRGIQFSVIRDATTNNFLKFKILFLHRKLFKNWEEHIEYTISGKDVYNALEKIMEQIYLVCNTQTSNKTIILDNSTYSNLLTNVFNTIYDLQDKQGKAVVEFEKKVLKIAKKSAFDIDVSVKATSAVSAKIGGGYGFEEIDQTDLYTGKWLKGKNYILTENKSLPIIDETYQNVVQDIVNRIPSSIRYSLGVISYFANIFTKPQSTNLMSEYSKFYIGDNGSYLEVLPTTIPSTIDSIFCLSWGWYGDSPSKSKKSLSKKVLKIYENNRIRSEKMYGMRYGIGGFYQFEPLNTTLNDTAFLTIKYNDEEVNGFKESDLGLYKEDKEKRSWIYIGGIVDTVNNKVKAQIAELALYTLAPKMPLGNFGLNLDNDSVYADGKNLVNVTSSQILYNDQSTIRDGELFTINCDYGSIVTKDVSDQYEGIQVAAKNGTIHFSIKAPTISGQGKISAFSVNGSAKGYTTVVFFDTLAPNPPRNLTVTRTQEGIYLNWRANIDNDIAGYRIYYDTDSWLPPYEGTATVYGMPSPIITSNDTTFFVRGLYNDSTYYFSITAFDIAGNESDYSQPVTIYPVAINDKEKTIPIHFELNQNFPNPFNPETKISFALPKASQVKIEIFNALGQRVAMPINRYFQAGVHQVVFNGNTLASGIYFYRIQAGKFSAVRKMILLK
ncbi:VWA domain-containing protein [Calditrichota bacterium GD2]